MSRLKLIPFLLVSCLPLTLAAGTNGPHWQQGEITSRQTIGPSHHNNHTRYVYCIKGNGVHYTARFDQPLSVRPFSPLNFAVSRRHLLVRDADGSELKADILTKSEPAIRR